MGLLLLPGLYVGPPLGWLDALFTATSAVTVTGLVVVDTATYFTRAGQAFLLLLIQLGGLGMIAFSSLIIIALGRRLSVRHERLAAGTLEIVPHLDERALARDILRFTFLLEAAGALLLYVFFIPRFGWGEGAWHAVFHAVSAFCNAGFSTFSDSLIGLQRSPVILMVLAVLIIGGGLGFLTMEELTFWRRARRSGRVRLSVHSRLVLVATAVLLTGGWVLYALFEWSVSLGGLPIGHRIVNSLFMSVTARSAGFNAVDYATKSDGSNFLTIILIFIGGSPGSTAGGLKTTTVAVLALLAWARIRGRQLPSVWGRSIPEETVQRAVGLSLTAFAVVTAAIFVYTVTERSGAGYHAEQADFLAYMFEAVSAFNTGGLSLGVTGELSVVGRLLTILLMFVGRVGPIAFAAALAVTARRGRVNYRYAYEDVVIG